jgi:potassium efflux system protein
MTLNREKIFVAGLAAAVFWLACPTISANAQDSDAVSEAGSDVTVDSIEALITAVESREGLDDEARSRAMDQLTDAIAQLSSRDAAATAAARYAQQNSEAPEEAARLREALDRPAVPPQSIADLGVAAETSLQELEQALARANAVRAGAETRLTELDATLAVQVERPDIARQRINELRATLEQLSGVLAAPAAADEPALLADARRLSTRARRNARTAELNRLEQELLSHSARIELLRAQRDMAAREVNENRNRTELLQEAVNSRRQLAAEQARSSAEEEELAMAGKHPVVRAIAERNRELSSELPAVAASIEQTTDELRRTEELAEYLQQSIARSRRQLEVGGVTQVIGRLLVEERRNLPNVTGYFGDVRERRKTLSRIGLAQVRIEEERRQLSSLDDAINKSMADVSDEELDAEQMAEIRDSVSGLLASRRELLGQVADTYRTYLRVLGEVDVAQRDSLEKRDEYRQFLDQNLIWIPSTSPLSRQSISDFSEAAARAVSPSAWKGTADALWTGMLENPIEAIAALLLIALVSFSRRPLARLMRQINKRVGRLSTDNIGITLLSLGIVIIRALPIPLAFFSASWFLIHSSASENFQTAVAQALISSAPFLYNLLLFRSVCARDGIAEVHFDWRKENLGALRRQLDRLIVIGVPLLFVAALAYASPNPAYRDGLGRILFIVLMLLLAFVMHRVFDPKRSLATRYYEKHPDRWVTRLKWFWYSAEIGVPLALALLASLGFLYTAAILTARLVDTIWLIVAIIIANLVVTRWLALARRKFEVQLAHEELEARKAEQDAEVETEVQADMDGTVPVAETAPLDLDVVNEQTRRLLHAGLYFLALLGVWGIWSDVLPALGILENVSLWTQTVTVDGAETIVPVTLADLLLAFLVAGATWLAVRNLPGLMEIAVLQHLDLAPGSHYTINTLVRYVVVTIGIFSVLSIIGWNWSRIQWLVAALSVGLGFGLQEIVANFVSGLIILFERPVRVGDTVTVGSLTGRVSRVRIRATTITDFDRKEIIVPNKSFITEQVVNWTLSDPITRIVIPVGIAYGSDVNLAHRVMEETLMQQPLILDEPAPKAFFVGFGESSLDFNLYVFSRQLADRFPITHAVHQDILQALIDNGINIPFPQRDLHMRSVTEASSTPPSDAGAD